MSDNGCVYDARMFTHPQTSLRGQSVYELHDEVHGFFEVSSDGRRRCLLCLMEDQLRGAMLPGLDDYTPGTCKWLHPYAATTKTAALAAHLKLHKRFMERFNTAKKLTIVFPLVCLHILTGKITAGLLKNPFFIAVMSGVFTVQQLAVVCGEDGALLRRRSTTDYVQPFHVTPSHMDLVEGMMFNELADRILRIAVNPAVPVVAGGLDESTSNFTHVQYLDITCSWVESNRRFTLSIGYKPLDRNNALNNATTFGKVVVHWRLNGKMSRYASDNCRVMRAMEELLQDLLLEDEDGRTLVLHLIRVGCLAHAISNIALAAPSVTMLRGEGITTTKARKYLYEWCEEELRILEALQRECHKFDGWHSLYGNCVREIAAIVAIVKMLLLLDEPVTPSNSGSSAEGTVEADVSTVQLGQANEAGATPTISRTNTQRLSAAQPDAQPFRSAIANEATRDIENAARDMAARIRSNRRLAETMLRRMQTPAPDTLHIPGLSVAAALRHLRLYATESGPFEFVVRVEDRPMRYTIADLVRVPLLDTAASRTIIRIILENEVRKRNPVEPGADSPRLNYSSLHYRTLVATDFLTKLLHRNDAKWLLDLDVIVRHKELLPVLYRMSDAMTSTAVTVPEVLDALTAEWLDVSIPRLCVYGEVLRFFRDRILRIEGDDVSIHLVVDIMMDMARFIRTLHMIATEFVDMVADQSPAVIRMFQETALAQLFRVLNLDDSFMQGFVRDGNGDFDSGTRDFMVRLRLKATVMRTRLESYYADFFNDMSVVGHFLRQVRDSPAAFIDAREEQWTILRTFWERQVPVAPGDAPRGTFIRLLYMALRRFEFTDDDIHAIPLLHHLLRDATDGTPPPADAPPAPRPSTTRARNLEDTVR